MSARSRHLLLTVLFLGAPEGSALAQKAAAGPSAPLLPGASSKEPVNIDAAKLDYFDKEQKLVYTGNVVAVQGDSTLKASTLVIYLAKQDAAAGGGSVAAGGPPASTGNSVRRMEAAGPVTLISKDQVGTGDNCIYDKAENKVYLNGHVTLSQGPNVTQGDKLIYDLNTSQAQVFSGQSESRVKSVFTPGSSTGPEAKTPANPGKTKPRQRSDAKAASNKGQ